LRISLEGNKADPSGRKNSPLNRPTPSTAQLEKFESLNATTSKKEYNIRDISSILYDMWSSYNFLKTLKIEKIFGGVGVGSWGVYPFLDLFWEQFW
jgi:hypothetical protein